MLPAPLRAASATDRAQLSLSGDGLSCRGGTRTTDAWSDDPGCSDFVRKCAQR